MNKLVHSHTVKYYSVIRGNELPKDMEEPKYRLLVKEVSLKRLHTVCFKLYDILKQQKYTVKRSVVACKEGEG